MPKTCKPWYSDTRCKKAGWWVTLDGHHIWLGLHPSKNKPVRKGGRWIIPAEIEQAWMAVINRHATTDRKDGNLVAAVFDAYLDHLLATYAETDAVYRAVKSDLQRFGEFHHSDDTTAVGLLPMHDLEARHFTGWLKTLNLKPNTVNTKHGRIMAAINWAAGEGQLLTRNPLMGGNGRPLVKRPQPTSKAIWATKTEYVKMMRQCGSRQARLIIFALRWSGARPSELFNLTTDMVDLSGPVPKWTMRDVRTGDQKHKTGRFGHHRSITLNPRLLLITKILMRKRESGEYLFQTPRGLKWTSSNLEAHMERAGEGIDKALTPYSIGRHTFATEALKGGVNPLVLKQFLGHTKKSRMLEHHYDHVMDDAAYVNEQASMITRKRK